VNEVSSITCGLDNFGEGKIEVVYFSVVMMRIVIIINVILSEIFIAARQLS
jgi:hypothetical protein